MHKLINFDFFFSLKRSHLEKYFSIGNQHFLKETLFTLPICDIPHGAVERNHHIFYQFHEKFTELCFKLLILTFPILGVEGGNWSLSWVSTSYIPVYNFPHAVRNQTFAFNADTWNIFNSFRSSEFVKIKGLCCFGSFVLGSER